MQLVAGVVGFSLSLGCMVLAWLPVLRALQSPVITYLLQ